MIIINDEKFLKVFRKEVKEFYHLPTDNFYFEFDEIRIVYDFEYENKIDWIEIKAKFGFDDPFTLNKVIDLCIQLNWSDEYLSGYMRKELELKDMEE